MTGNSILRLAVALAALSALMCLFPYRPPIDGGYEPVMSRALQLLHYPLSFVAIAVAVNGIVVHARQRPATQSSATSSTENGTSSMLLAIQVVAVLLLINCHRLLALLGVAFVPFDHTAM